MGPFIIVEMPIPFALVAWLVWILNRAVRSLERIADAAERRMREAL